MNDPAPTQQLQSAAEKVFQAASSAARQDLQNDPHGQKITELVQNAHRLTDSVIREVVEIGLDPMRPVCCQGCTACCYLHLVTTQLEVLAAADCLRSQMSETELAAIGSRIDHHIEVTKGLDASKRRTTRLACPLLVDGSCTIYSHRPISCRGWNSLDRTCCDADLANPESNIAMQLNVGQFALAGRVAEGLSAASHSIECRSQQVDFVRALRIALDDPSGAAKEWRAGADVFVDAVTEHVFPGSVDAEQQQARESLWKLFVPPRAGWGTAASEVGKGPT